MDTQKFFADLRRQVVRALRSNFAIDHATPEEREQLEQAPVPILDPIVQDYVVWRRAMLGLSAFAMVILVLLQIFSFQGFAESIVQGQVEADPNWESYEPEYQAQVFEASLEDITDNFGEENLEIIDGIQVTYLLAQIVGTVLVWYAAKRWRRLTSSKRLARWGWLVVFVTPFVLSALPVTEMLDWDGVEESQREQIKMTLGVMFALGYFMLVGPKAISLFPGIMRSSMTLKTLLPESSAPGWAAVLAAPLYAIFMIMVASTVIQIQGSPSLLFGIIFLMAAPLVYLVRARVVLLPRRPEEVSALVVGVRRVAGICNLIGGLFLAFFMVQSDLFGLNQAVQFALGVMAGVALLTVVASDLILALLWASYVQGKAFQGTAMQADLELKFEALSAVGLTNLASRGVVSAPAPGASATASETAAQTAPATPKGPHEQAVAADGQVPGESDGADLETPTDDGSVPD